MSKEINQNNRADVIMNRYLWAALVVMALPLLLEFFVLGPLFLTHSINREGYGVISRIIGFAAVSAGIVGIAGLPFIVSRKKIIKSNTTKRLYKAVITVSTVYYIALIIFLGSFFFLIQSNQ